MESKSEVEEVQLDWTSSHELRGMCDPYREWITWVNCPPTSEESKK